MKQRLCSRPRQTGRACDVGLVHKFSGSGDAVRSERGAPYRGAALRWAGQALRDLYVRQKPQPLPTQQRACLCARRRWQRLRDAVPVCWARPDAAPVPP